MALFERSPARTAEMAVEAAEKLKQEKFEVLENAQAEHVRFIDEHAADVKAVADVQAELAAADSEAVKARRAKKPLPSKADIRARLEEAEYAEQASRKLVEEAALALEDAQEDFKDATKALFYVKRHEIFLRLARALESAKQIDDELVAQNGYGLDVAALIERVNIAAKECANPPETLIVIERSQSNGLGFITRQVPVASAVEDVAKGPWWFTRPIDERRYGTQVVALKEQLAAAK